MHINKFFSRHFTKSFCRELFCCAKRVYHFRGNSTKGVIRMYENTFFERVSFTESELLPFHKLRKKNTFEKIYRRKRIHSAMRANYSHNGQSYRARYFSSAPEDRNSRIRLACLNRTYFENGQCL